MKDRLAGAAERHIWDFRNVGSQSADQPGWGKFGAQRGG
jgi:hypothetical protein